MTQFEAIAAVGVLAPIFRDAEVRKEGGLHDGRENYFVRVYINTSSFPSTLDVSTAESAGHLIASKIRSAQALNEVKKK